VVKFATDTTQQKLKAFLSIKPTGRNAKVFEDDDANWINGAAATPQVNRLLGRDDCR
jgi:hypothetical protein